jgi:chemotaxis protein MotB
MSENEEQTPEDAPVPEVQAPVSARRATGGNEEPAPVPLWLITFTDIMALMLTFFVLLYSMSVPEVEKWESMTSALNKGFSTLQTAKWYQGPQDTIDIEKLDFSTALDLNYLDALVKDMIAKNDNLKGVMLIQQEDRLVMSLPLDMLFEPGKSGVTVQGKKALFSLGGPLSRIRNRIEVFGHSEPGAAGAEGSSFSSDWALSITRAAEVAGVLENVGYSRPVTIRGYASARYEELPADMDETERLDLARRVDVVIMKDDGSQRLFMQ